MSLAFKDKVIEVIRYFCGEVDEIDPKISKELDNDTIKNLMEYGRIYKLGRRLDRKGAKSGEVHKRLIVIESLLKTKEKKAFEFILYNLKTLKNTMSEGSYYRFRNGLKEIKEYNKNDYKTWKYNQDFTEEKLAKFLDGFKIEKYMK